MARWVNHSGTAVNLPLIERDVDDGEEIDVPDDVLLPENIFRRAEKTARKQQPAPASKSEGE